MQVAFIGCTKRKKGYPCPAYEMYSMSALFRKAYAYCNDHYDRVYILSAKYGLVEPKAIIEPYDITLSSMNAGQKREWAAQVILQLKAENEAGRLDLGKVQKFVFHTGEEYRRYLVDLLPSGLSLVPLKGMGIGQQLRFYTERGYK
ncbi:MAG TPA: hypothetical protein PL078_05395 [Bacillota bacterium]|jgi:hypothetical protein|nr:hypothetical protein [Peptococcaceae bacterium MAG4]NLW37018.1 hypothetical protein [Peptococcaceae bacterium]HPZ43420.1 hypothetical protein [Bacillota bacterium]HQD75914.1 hypothetical protein [Bacillota bacterium]HUM58704.1 hypothetical protein [Bacillota bacterium]